MAAVVLVQLGAGAVRDVTSLMAPDTRAAALAYAEKDGIEEHDTTFEGYTGFLPGDYRLFFKHVRQRPDGSYQFVTNEGQPAKYVMLSSLMYGRVLRDPAYDAQSDIYRWLFDNGTELAQVRACCPGAELLVRAGQHLAQPEGREGVRHRRDDRAGAADLPGAVRVGDRRVGRGYSCTS